jgi:serine/threonine-protein kinase
MFNLGTQISQYRIISHLGSGGMGEVFLAKDLRLGREVAIKVLYERMAKDSALVARFEREARSLAALSHPNILTIYDFSSENGTAFAVMEYLEGETLRTWITRRPLDWQKALEIAILVAEGLAAAHSKAVIHRDLKPENIFITNAGLVKILDFGLARVETTHLSNSDMGSFATVGELETAPGVIMGTIPYMSPEQVCGSGIDTRTDIFSFGCVLYEMLTGISPFNRTTAIETSAAILKDKPFKISKLTKKLPSDLEWVIMRCLEKDREERFPSARDLVAALKAVLAHSSNFSNTSSFANEPWKKNKKSSSRRHRKMTDSIAILPFTNISKDPESEYLSDGLTENIINLLAQIPKLRVMARSTVFRYKNREINPQEVGHELHVQTVLTGEVTHYGDLLKIQTELVDVADGSQIWGEQYNRKFNDLIAVQEEIAHQISEKLQMKLSGEDKKRLSKGHTENTKAYELYLKGRYYWNKRTPSSIKKSIELFHQAIDLDPIYASAYAGIADCYVLLGLYGTSDAHEAFAKAEAAATKALQMEDLAEAHTALGSVRIYYYWDWVGAEREFKRALELNPDYPTAHHWYGTHLIRMGRFDEGLAQLKRAQQLDPLSLVINQSIGWAYYLSRQYDQAVVQYLKVIEMDENFYFPHAELGVVYLLQKKYSEALAEITKSYELVGSKNVTILALLGHTHALSGNKSEAEKILSQLKDLEAQNARVSPVLFSMFYASLGNIEQAFHFLEKACEKRDEILIRMRVDPIFDPLRVYPHFAELMKKVGLPE